ncbi:tetratricopeptide repeat protein [archaeon AH-315-M20]|nr:tetratricopeptide repeat protein [archaeon AH-315-M20]
MKINKILVIILALVIINLISYFNIFQNEFAWDDFTFITSNKKITSPEYIPYHFTHESRNSLWRPLRETLYIFTYSIWNLNTFGYHLNSLLLHTLITIFVFFIIANLAKNRELALFVALLFATHPIHTARVTNMTASFDMLGLLFFLIGFYFFIKYRQTEIKKFYFYSLFVYILALLSSEEAITFIGILLLYDICFTKQIHISKIKQVAKQYSPYLAVTFVYVVTHILIVGRVGRVLTYFEDSFYITFLNSVKAVIFNIKLLILPLNLSVYQSIPKATSILSIPFLVSFFILMSLIFIIVFSFKKSKIVFFSFSWFFITMFLFYNFIPKSTLLADRYLYFPSLGFCLLLGYFVFKIRDLKSLKKYGKILSISVLVLLLVFYSVLTIQRNTDWKDEGTLLKKAVEVSPISTNAHWALAGYYKKTKNYDLAKHHLHTAINISSKNYIALKLLGTVYAETQDYEKAIFYLKKSIKIASPEEGGYYRANNDLGLVYSYIGDLNSSIFYLKKAIEINPKLSKAHNDIATIYAKIGKFNLAIEEINMAIEINPYDADYYYNLAVIYEFLNNNKKAEELLLKALELEPDNEKIKSKLVKLKS